MLRRELDPPHGVGHALNAWFDPRDDAESVSLGWCGEEPGRGVWYTRHPEAVYLEHPEVWEQVQRVLASQTELTSDDYDSLSHHDYQLRVALVAAYQRRREQERKSHG